MKNLLPLLACCISVPNLSSADLQPLLTKPAETSRALAVEDDFETPHALDKAVWQQRQGTRWAIEDGVLRGRPSSAEYQAKKSHHRGLEPRLSVPATPAEFLARFKVRFVGGEANPIVPFVEFGHHVCRVRFHADGLEVLAEGESLIVARTDEVTYEQGRWYSCLAEMRGNQFIMQIDDGPTLYAVHESFRHAPTSGGNGFGVAGPRDGLVELDDIQILRVDRHPARGWEQAIDRLETMDPVVIPKAREKFLAKQKKS